MKLKIYYIKIFKREKKEGEKDIFDRIGEVFKIIFDVIMNISEYLVLIAAEIVFAVA